MIFKDIGLKYLEDVKKNCIYICIEMDMNVKYIKCNMYSNVNIISIVYWLLNEVFVYEEM